MQLHQLNFFQILHQLGPSSQIYESTGPFSLKPPQHRSWVWWTNELHRNMGEGLLKLLLQKLLKDSCITKDHSAQVPVDENLETCQQAQQFGNIFSRQFSWCLSFFQSTWLVWASSRHIGFIDSLSAVLTPLGRESLVILFSFWDFLKPLNGLLPELKVLSVGWNVLSLL